MGAPAWVPPVGGTCNLLTCNPFRPSPGRRREGSATHRSRPRLLGEATRQRWRALALWIKAVLEAAEAGITTLEEALQPFTMLPDGCTVGEWMALQIEAAYETGRMPPMLPLLEDEGHLCPR